MSPISKKNISSHSQRAASSPDKTLLVLAEKSAAFARYLKTNDITTIQDLYQRSQILSDRYKTFSAFSSALKAAARDEYFPFTNPSQNELLPLARFLSFALAPKRKLNLFSPKPRPAQKTAPSPSAQDQSERLSSSPKLNSIAFLQKNLPDLLAGWEKNGIYTIAQLKKAYKDSRCLQSKGSLSKAFVHFSQGTIVSPTGRVFPFANQVALFAGLDPLVVYAPFIKSAATAHKEAQKRRHNRSPSVTTVFADHPAFAAALLALHPPISTQSALSSALIKQGLKRANINTNMYLFRTKGLSINFASDLAQLVGQSPQDVFNLSRLRGASPDKAAAFFIKTVFAKYPAFIAATLSLKTPLYTQAALIEALMATGIKRVNIHNSLTHFRKKGLTPSFAQQLASLVNKPVADLFGKVFTPKKPRNHRPNLPLSVYFADYPSLIAALTTLKPPLLTQVDLYAALAREGVPSKLLHNYAYTYKRKGMSRAFAKHLEALTHTPLEKLSGPSFLSPKKHVKTPPVAAAPRAPIIQQIEVHMPSSTKPGLSKNLVNYEIPAPLLDSFPFARENLAPILAALRSKNILDVREVFDALSRQKAGVSYKDILSYFDGRLVEMSPQTALRTTIMVRKIAGLQNMGALHATAKTIEKPIPTQPTIKPVEEVVVAASQVTSFHPSPAIFDALVKKYPSFAKKMATLSIKSLEDLYAHQQKGTSCFAQDYSSLQIFTKCCDEFARLDSPYINKNGALSLHPVAQILQMRLGFQKTSPLFENKTQKTQASHQIKKEGGSLLAPLILSSAYKNIRIPRMPGGLVLREAKDLKDFLSYRYVSKRRLFSRDLVKTASRYVNEPLPILDDAGALKQEVALLFFSLKIDEASFFSVCPSLKDELLLSRISCMAFPSLGLAMVRTNITTLSALQETANQLCLPYNKKVVDRLMSELRCNDICHFNKETSFMLPYFSALFNIPFKFLSTDKEAIPVDWRFNSEARDKDTIAAITESLRTSDAPLQTPPKEAPTGKNASSSDEMLYLLMQRYPAFKKIFKDKKIETVRDFYALPFTGIKGFYSTYELFEKSLKSFLKEDKDKITRVDDRKVIHPFIERMERALSLQFGKDLFTRPPKKEPIYPSTLYTRSKINISKAL